MSSLQLVADSGATKTSWCLFGRGKEPRHFFTQGLSPYFFTGEQMTAVLKKELPADVLSEQLEAVHFYGTGCAEDQYKEQVEKSIREAIPGAGEIMVATDLLAAARSLCGHRAGIAGILGTGSNSCFFDGTAIVKNNPAPGFILGDEGSGAYLGKKVVQYFIYGTFDEDLMHKFNLKFETNYREILRKVYKEPLPNRYLASFCPFLSENRGHYMVENIIEDGLSDFFMTHLYKYSETWTHPLHFTGSIAWYFKDVLEELCNAFELQLGTVLKAPIDGLVAYHEGKI